MSKEILKVKNFGPIKDVELELGKVNVFIGEQAGGKSTLAKLIAIFKDGRIPLNSNNKDRILQLFDVYNIQNYFHENSYIKYEKEDFYSAELLVRDGKPGTYVKINNKYLSELIKAFKEEQRKIILINEEKSKAILEKEYEKVSHLREEESELNRKINIISNELSVVIPLPLYYPAERYLFSMISNALTSFNNSQIPLPRCLLLFGSFFESARIQVGNINLGFGDIKYVFEDKIDKVFLKSKKEPIQLQESSSGVQSVVPLMLVTELFSKVDHDDFMNESRTSFLNNEIAKRFDKDLLNYERTFIIEEPELNLYPTIQRRIIEYLIEKCTHRDDKLVVTTHSPYILTAISNLILAGNIFQNHPDLKKEVTKLVPEKYHLAFEDVQAYYFENGTARSIMDKEYQTIDASPIDDVSNDLGETFDRLLDLKYQNK